MEIETRIRSLPNELQTLILETGDRLKRVHRFRILERRARYAVRTSVRMFLSSLVSEFGDILDPTDLNALLDLFSSEMESIVGPSYHDAIPDPPPLPTTTEDLETEMETLRSSVYRVHEWFFFGLFAFLDKLESRWLHSAYFGYLGTELLEEKSAEFGFQCQLALVPFHDALYDLLDDRVDIDLTESPEERWMRRLVTAIRRFGPATLWVRSGPLLMPEARLEFAETWMSSLEDAIGPFFSTPYRFNGEDMRPGTPGFKTLIAAIHTATAEAAAATAALPPFVGSSRHDLPMALYQTLIDLIYQNEMDA